MNKIDIKETGQVYIMHCNDYHYVGVHKGDIFKDNYFGSGIAWRNVVNKYGKENIIREVIDTYDNQQTRDDLEKHYITLYKSLYENKLLNIAEGGQGGNLGPEVNAKISKAVSGCGNGMYGRRLCGALNGMYGKTHPGYNKGNHYKLDMPERSAKLSIANKGKHHTEETKNKIRIARKNQKNLNLKSATGKHWYYNKETDEELQIFEKDKPEGFELGRRPQSTKGKIYWNNGETDILLSINELPPKGFVKGRRTEIKYDESRNKKISEKLKGKPKSDQHKKNLSEANKGKVSPMKGKHLSEESKRRISESTKGRIPWNKGLKLKEFI